MPRPYKKPANATIYTCLHCGVQMKKPNMQDHVRICAHNPEATRRLLEFVHANSTDGYMLTQREYEYDAVKQGLTSRQTVMSRFGSWAKFADWAGLLFRPDVKPRDKELSEPLPENFRLFHLPLEKADQPEGLPVYKALRLVRAWDVKGHCYQPIGWERVWAVR